jgi:hypothetical protein
VERARLHELLASKLEHLPSGGQAHFHIAVSTENEFEWDVSRFVSSPPYRALALAQADAGDSRFRDKVDGFDIDILECSRVCPHSGLGRFGWDDEQPGYQWWDSYRWK